LGKLPKGGRKTITNEGRGASEKGKAAKALGGKRKKKAILPESFVRPTEGNKGRGRSEKRFNTKLKKKGQGGITGIAVKKKGD